MSEASEEVVARAEQPAAKGILRKLLPWLSFAVGVASALLMERGPKRALLVACAAVAVWLALVLLQWFGRLSEQPRERGRVRRWLLWAGRKSTLVATQSLIQLTLFFSLPFYFQAATFDGGHAIFLGVLSALCGVTLWDPWTARLLGRPLLAPLLPMAGSFVALTAVLPGLGLSTHASLWVAACTSSAGVPLMAAAAACPPRRGLALVLSSAIALGLPGALLLGGARFVPAAPLRLVKVEIGTQRAGRWIADPVEFLAVPPERLICATAIASPVGVKDRLFHVWRKDGRERARIRLKIVGGRKLGYRTQSRIGGFGSGASGVFSCTVVTASGQVLGSARVRIGR